MKTFEGQVIYQVYPRSFFDANGDGIGDLRGIAEKLDYIKSLNVDYIWISPFYPSPMKDFGYDVSDYRGIDPQFGDFDDFNHLIKKAHEYGLKIMIDLVISHTSNLHPWFQESRKGKSNAYRDWYVWADPKDGKNELPNNWLSIFGGPSWEFDKESGQFYLHNFLKEQPDLNFHNPKVQEAMLEIAKFWLEKKVDGFRLDTVNFYFHDTQLRDNPLKEVKSAAFDTPDCNPYQDQVHLYDKNRPENLAFLQKLRNLTDQYGGAVLLGEVGANEEAREIIRQYTEGSERLHSAYAFDFMGNSFDAETFSNIITSFWNAAPESLICNAFGNHDMRRLVSRWNPEEIAIEEFTKLVCVMLLSLKGSSCVYQGEELALTEYDIKFDEIQDPYGKAFWPDYKGRDGCRTPFVWDSKAKNAGFSNSNKPWLPVAAEHVPKSVNEQEKKEHGTLNFYRKFLRLRKSLNELLYGEIKSQAHHNGVLQITRKYEGSVIECYFNMKYVKSTMTISSGELIISGSSVIEGSELEMEGFGFALLRSK